MGDNLGVKSVKLMYFLKNLLFYSGTWSIQYKCIGRVFQIVNFMTPGVGIVVQGRGHICYIVKMHFFFISSSLLPGI